MGSVLEIRRIAAMAPKRGTAYLAEVLLGYADASRGAVLSQMGLREAQPGSRRSVPGT